MLPLGDSRWHQSEEPQQHIRYVGIMRHISQEPSSTATEIPANAIDTGNPVQSLMRNTDLGR